MGVCTLNLGRIFFHNPLKNTLRSNVFIQLFYNNIVKRLHEVNFRI